MKVPGGPDREPGLTLIHHGAQPGSSGDIIGSLESWGQWGTGGDLSACHVEGFHDAAQIARMNPKVSMLYAADQAPWAIMSALRLDLSRFAGYGAPRYPGQDPAFQAAFRAEVQTHLGEPYAWGQIIRFSCIGLLARVWPGMAQKMLASANNTHANVCSQWWTARIEAAVQKTYGHLSEHLAKYDLFEGTDVGDGEERPADYIKSLDLKPWGE